MPQPVTEKVYFTLTVRSFNRGDHWATKALETSTYTYAATKEEAEALNAQAHIDLIQSMKKEGRRALLKFMKDSGFKDARIGGRRPRNTAKPTVTWGPMSESELAQAA